MDANDQDRALSDGIDERRLAAIILGDVVGYSRLMGQDEVATMTALKAHRNELVLPAIAAYRGRMVDTPGDAMLMEFVSAVDAVACAVAIQRRMILRNADVPEERRLSFRLGINLGDIVIDGDKIYGDGVNVAARLESQCQPGGLCISRSIAEQMRGKLNYPFVDGGEQALKNIAHPVQIFRLSPEFIATLPDTPLPAARRSGSAHTSRSVTSHHDTTEPPRIGPGTILNGTYEIDLPIGGGGMGEIFKGHEIHSGGLVAIKVIRPDMMDNKTALALFQKEALVLKDINHDAIVRYYSFSSDPALRRHYLAMEFVDGTALSELVRQKPLASSALAALRARVAAGLDVAHRRGVIHRDVSPDNIIVPLGDVARAKIIDFGIARAADIGGGTIIGAGFAGKYNYVSPEQLGLQGGEVTPQSDIYSFGLVLAEASRGAPIDMGGTPAEAIERRQTLPDLHTVDPVLRPLIERMLQPEPRLRPGSMAEIANWTGGGATVIALSPPPGVPATAPPAAAALAAAMMQPAPGGQAAARQATPVRPRRRTGRSIIGATLGALLLGGAGLGAYEVWFAPPRPRILLPNPTDVITPRLDATPPKTDIITAQAGAEPSQAEPPPVKSAVPAADPPQADAQPVKAAVPGAEPVKAPERPPVQTAGIEPPPKPASGHDQPLESSGDEPDAADKPNQQAALPVSPPRLPPSPLQADIDRISDFVKTFPHDPCVFLHLVKVTSSSAAIAGFAQSRNAFETLDRAFAQTIGFSPDIVGQLIAPKQCPALDFLRRTSGGDETPPTLFLKSFRVGTGQSLSGEMHGFGRQEVALLQLQEDGTVLNVTKALKRDGDARTFDLPMTRQVPGGSAPQMLILVASLRPLAVLAKEGPQAAEPLFRSILDEAAGRHDRLSVDAKVFRLGG